MQLPLSQVKRFSKLFHEIQNAKSSLRISEYGISITTLQEVFLRVAEENQEKKQRQERQSVEATPSHPSSHGRLPEKVKRIPRVGQQLQKIRSQTSLDSINVTKQNASKVKKSKPVQEEQVRRYNDSCTRFSTHFKATFLKRFRIIKRDVKTFLFQLILPLAVIICALLLMTISYTNNMPAQYINLSTHLSQQNPVALPIGSSNAALLTGVTGVLNTKYGSQISLSVDSTNTVAADFDKNFLLPIKKSQTTLKGGLFFLPSTVEGANTVYPFYSLSVTRSPTSYFFLPTIAAQALINHVFSKNIQITVANHPLPLTYDQRAIGTVISGFLGAFVFILALAFKYASIISLIVKEREDKVKHQQIVSGMKLSAYWLANFMYDYTRYLCVALPAAALCKAMNVAALSTGNAFLATWLLFIAYGLAYIPLTYIFAFLIKSTECTVLLLLLNHFNRRNVACSYLCSSYYLSFLQPNRPAHRLGLANLTGLCFWIRNNQLGQC